MLASYISKMRNDNVCWFQHTNKGEIYNDIAKRKGLVSKCKHKDHKSPKFLPVRFFSLKDVNHETKLPSLQSYCKSCYKKDYAKKALSILLFGEKGLFKQIEKDNISCITCHDSTLCISELHFPLFDASCGLYTSTISMVDTFVFMPDKDDKEYIQRPTCEQCGSSDHLVTSHIYPIEQGGNDTIQNKQTLCFKCSKKWDMYSFKHYDLTYISERYHEPLMNINDPDICKLLQKEVKKFKKLHVSSDTYILRQTIRMYSKKHGISVNVDHMTKILQKIKFLTE